MKNNAQKILLNILKASPQTYSEFLILKKRYSGQAGLAPLANATLIEAWRQMKIPCSRQPGCRLRDEARGRLPKIDEKKILNWLTKRPTRTLSGVTPLTVLTKPYSCPGQCIYCPNEPGMPKSYLSNEPAAQRAKLNNFDPVKQVKMRIRALEANGHTVDKIELLILGGCFNAYPKKYQEQFIKKCFDVCNGEWQGRSLPSLGNRSPDAGSRWLHSGSGRPSLPPAKTLEQAFKLNESAQYRIIGITVETRPDLINEKEIKWFRYLGVTRVQLGVQHLDNKILKLIKRGHDANQTIKATKLLKRAGFKIDYHLMPDLPGSTPQKDLQMFKKIFTDPNFQPDQIKIYPTIVNKFAPLAKWLKAGKYKPYSEKQLLNLLVKVKQLIPYYVRINRLIRDIPKESIMAGNKITNLREFVQLKLKGLAPSGVEGCKCIRCREAKENITGLKKAKLFTEKYRASDGWEYFISYESPKRDKLYSFIRIRFNDDQNKIIDELKDAAIVRELHTYGQLVPTGSGRPSLPPAVQHTGFGKRLMKIAEDLATKQGYKKIAVIAGIGVRPYYKKLGYSLQGTYMVKNLK